jgi:hypothetical protein
MTEILEKIWMTTDAGDNEVQKLGSLWPYGLPKLDWCEDEILNLLPIKDT